MGGFMIYALLVIDRVLSRYKRRDGLVRIV